MRVDDKSPTAGNELTEYSKEAHRAASPVRQDACVSYTPTEQWYFRIDGREFGPSSRDQLEHFLTPPRLCTSLEVMCSEREGHWFLIAKDESIEMVLEKVGIRLEPEVETEPQALPTTKVSESVNSVNRLSDATKTVVSAVVRYRVLIVGFVVFASINVLVFYLTRDKTIREREILSRFESLLNSACDFKSQSHSDNEWRSFADDAKKKIEPLVNELARTASVKQPVRQKLLFAGRDHLEKLFEAVAPPTKSSPDARMVEKYLHLVRNQLQKKTDRPEIERSRR